MISEQEVFRLIKFLPKSVVLVLDLAYSEYVTSGLTDAAKLVESGSNICLLYTSPSPRDRQKSRMPSSS